MEIYIVQEGDTINSIADKYGISVEKLLIDNSINDPNKLVIGQTIIIAYPKQTHVVQQGDTIQSVAGDYNVSVMQLLRNNPNMMDRNIIQPGETLVISYNTGKSITTNGYAFPYINQNILIKTLPGLTYLSIFNYRISESIEITQYYDDTEIINLSKIYGTIPLLLFSVLTLTGEADVETAYRILLNNDYQEKVVNDLTKIAKDRGYLGINWTINILNHDNQSLIVQLMQKISERLKRENLLFIITVNFDDDLMNDNIDYSGFNLYADDIILIKLIWGVNYNPPAPVSDINDIKHMINNTINYISNNKIVLGKPTIGYDWQLPYISDRSVAVSLNYNSVLELAYDVNAAIQFDESSQTPYFTYNQTDIGFPSQHIVWFIDARSINALLKLVDQYNLGGSGIWNIMIYNSQLWLPIYSQYDIIKYI